MQKRTDFVEVNTLGSKLQDACEDQMDHNFDEARLGSPLLDAQADKNVDAEGR